jgi:hypothetical protein
VTACGLVAEIRDGERAAQPFDELGLLVRDRRDAGSG